jgi:pullulanase
MKRLNTNYSLVYLVCFFSLCYLGFLAFSIHDGIFFAGDEGIKSLVVKQITQGYGFKYLHMGQPEWVQSVWQAGYFPLKAPFFYPSQQGYIIVFPPAFQIITAFFYSRLGTTGLYILPVLCTIILLIWFIVLLKRCGIRPSMIALALFVLVFCSPLALYGVMFWEHLPAVLLLFAGLAFIVNPPDRIWSAVALGFVSGLAVWLRPEALVMDFLYALAVGILLFRERRLANPAFLTGLALAVFGLFVFNEIEYGSLLGVHGQQLFKDSNPETRMGVHNGLRNLIANNEISIRNFFFVLLLLPIAYRLIRKSRDTGNLRPGLLSAIVFVYSLVTPFLLPNDGVVQWGARYFLPIIPITLVTLVLVEKQWNIIEGRRIPVWLTCFIVLGVFYSFYHNTHGGGYKELRWRYNDRLSASYNLINKKSGNVVIFSHQSMAYDFAYLFDKDYFFAASGDDSLRRLLPLLKKSGVHEFIYIFDPRVPTLPKMLEDSTTSHWWDNAAKKIWIKDEFASKVYTIDDSLPAFDRYPVYSGKDLGLRYSPSASAFRIWAPTAEAARLLLYADDRSPVPIKIVELSKGQDGTWWTNLSGNWKNFRYAFSARINNEWRKEVPDPYARAVGLNGKRAVILDLSHTDPPGWTLDKSPAFSAANLPTDAVIYELHLRDISIHPGSGIREKGKYAGLAEWDTRNSDGLTTGLSHLKELGVTHLHLLPFFDYNSVDESRPDSLQYNWGYDPLNYDAPEGSYSTNPEDAAVRIRELKQMIAAIHRHGLRIIMDVVYNHTALTDASVFNELVPGYYYRHKKDNSLSNATGCGNETASEMPMFRKFMLESVLFWAREYHIDGFRFDLMGVHDITTMNLLSDSLHRLRPDILLYGEGWTAGDCPLPDSTRALKKNVSRLHGIAVFGDDLRDGIKGSVFDAHNKGFVAGNEGLAESVKFGISAACFHPQIDYSKVNYSHAAFATAPAQVITYCECHDNNTLWDKLTLSRPEASAGDKEKMQRLALTIVLTSQGIPFLSEGTEFLRSKKGIDNSYNAGDSINAIDWSVKKQQLPLVQYLQGLIRMRREHPAFRMTTADQIRRYLHFETAPAGCVAYTLDGAGAKDSWKFIYIAFNGSGTASQLSLPGGDWHVSPITSGAQIKNGHLLLGAYNTAILTQTR